MSTSPDQSKRKQHIAEVFNRAARTYDHVGPNVFAYFGQRLVDYAQMQTGKCVLDVACGRGALLFPAARVVGKKGLVIGTDLSETMVAETRKEVKRLRLTNIDVRQMDAESLQFPDASFDYVLCGFALFFFPDLTRALAEMHRVLKPGGYLVVSTWEKYEDESWNWFDELIEEFLPPKQAAVSEAGSQPPPPELDTADGMARVLKEAGFVEVQCESDQFETVYHDEKEWWAVQWSHGVRFVLERIESELGTGELERFKTAAFTGLANNKQSDGIHSHWPALFTLATKPGH